MNGREQTSEADEVVEVVNVVRVPVVLGTGAEIEVIYIYLLILLLGPAQFLVDVAGAHQRTIGVVHLFPIQWYFAEFLGFLSHD
jgi:hypothetical protein